LVQIPFKDTIMTHEERAAEAAAERICLVNDEFRRTLSGGSLVLTVGVIQQGRAFQEKAVARLLTCDDFTPDNDPYGEHDFGSLEIDGVRLFFKIDYYDKALASHSPDPTDRTQTHRVMTLMLADEY
jgi:hypothetical protein